jgi:hypothetical protein
MTPLLFYRFIVVLISVTPFPIVLYETGSHYVAQTDLEFMINLNLPGARITGIPHHACPFGKILFTILTCLFLSDALVTNYFVIFFPIRDFIQLMFCLELHLTYKLI